MTQFAEHVYTAQHDIARIESWAGQLEDEARVEILLVDGARVEGFVAARPTIQVFRHGAGREGMNAMVRIAEQDNPEHAHYLGLDRSIDMRRTGQAWVGSCGDQRARRGGARRRRSAERSRGEEGGKT